MFAIMSCRQIQDLDGNVARIAGSFANVLALVFLIRTSLNCINACHTHLYKPKPWLIALILEPFIVPLKADLQAPACFSEYHDNDHLLIPIKDVRSDDYAPGTTSSEEF